MTKAIVRSDRIRSRSKRPVTKLTLHSHSSRSKLDNNIYNKDTTELDKAIATLRNGRKKDLRAKYKEYLEKCHA